MISFVLIRKVQFYNYDDKLNGYYFFVDIDKSILQEKNWVCINYGISAYLKKNTSYL